jgi:hypothetical protein
MSTFEDDFGTKLRNVHQPSKCEGHACVIHHPSDHSMRKFPLLWRIDKRVFERICPHGIGHPDPDDIEFQDQPWLTIHGCDGCCQ